MSYFTCNYLLKICYEFLYSGLFRRGDPFYLRMVMVVLLCFGWQLPLFSIFVKVVIITHRARAGGVYEIICTICCCLMMILALQIFFNKGIAIFSRDRSITFLFSFDLFAVIVQFLMLLESITCILFRSQLANTCCSFNPITIFLSFYTA